MADTHTAAGQHPTLDLQPMSADAAEQLGIALAAIDPWARYGYKSAALTAYLADSEADVTRRQIRAGGELAGAYVVRRNWLRGPYLQFLGILPPFQRHGIGSFVLSGIERDARATQAQNLWVVASEFNERGLAFYERFGFTRVAVLNDLVAKGTDEVLLRKQL